MAINPAPAASAQLPSEFKTEYHPRSGRPTLFQPFNKFHISSQAQHTPIIDKEPWCPFRSHGDFEFSEIAIEAALNKSQINTLLSLIMCISEGNAQITLKNEADLSKAWDNAAVELTPFSKHEVSVTYKKNEQVYKVHAWPIWDWVLNLLDNALLAPHFVWHTCHVFKHNGTRWWDIQSSLPDIDGSIPFCFILYADKTKLLSHGMVKGYPVVNGEVFGGGHVVGWLPIVPEDAGKEGKLGYTMLKHVVWHESFFKLLELAAQYSKTGYTHKCHDDILQWCMMPLIHGRGGKWPCPVCLVPLAELHDLSKTYPLRSMEEVKEALRVYRHSKAQGEELLKALGLWPVENIFWIIWFSDPHNALSFDRIHSLHSCIWKHLLGELKKILTSLGREAEAAFEKLIDDFPQWCNLNHFKSTINVLFSNGNKHRDLSKQSLYALLTILTARTSPEGYQLLHIISTYLQLDSLIGLDVHTEGMLAAIEAKLLVFDTELKAYVTCAKSSDIEKLKLDWNFPKMHLWKHIVHDIQHKGVAHNFSMHLNKKMHGPLKDTYHHRTNRKDVTMQVDEHDQLQALGDDLPDEDVAVTFNGHVKLGAPTQHPLSILDLENCSSVDHAFQVFQRKFTEFINHSLPTYGHQLTNWITFPANYQIHEHRYLKVNYKSMVNWKQVTDHLRCDLQFHGLLQFNHALIQCCISNFGSFKFALIQPYTVRINGAHRTDRFIKLTHVKAVPRASSIFIPLSSFIQGAVLVPDHFGHPISGTS
ncbi:uncharacterized protein EDB91DRAFT_1238449 [Suillus paluster]|uniref:uncharacterized protein n=1 Tax=Suillus paluster TaxID=48578 RepID=UPI001B8841EE|nr:uncharacterized protein EDB91DRAFT_1238449 [Suillus paluster]KAG1734249.1 hypothetical protein EDB91DRAFT_1238449 [Suillus paluster]